MTNEQIKHMVNRFLGWKLPENFKPDGGIYFSPKFNEFAAHPMKHEPVGTNLFDAQQAEAMVRYMLDALPPAAPEPKGRTVEVRAAVAVTKDGNNWRALGWMGAEDEYMMRDALCSPSWLPAAILTARVPLPEVTTIAADVEPVSPEGAE